MPLGTGPGGLNVPVKRQSLCTTKMLALRECTMYQVDGEVGRRIVRKANLVGLVDEENVGDSIPTPHTSLGAVCTVRQLYDLAWPILLKETEHAATAGSAIEPDGERCGFRRLASFDEPKESVDGVVLLDRREGKRRQADIARKLPLRIEDGSTSASVGLLVGYGDIGIYGRAEDVGEAARLGELSEHGRDRQSSDYDENQGQNGHCGYRRLLSSMVVVADRRPGEMSSVRDDELGWQWTRYAEPVCGKRLLATR